MIHFAAYTAADSQCFPTGRTTTKIAPFRRDLNFHPIRRSLGQRESVPLKRLLDRFSRYHRTHERDQQTDKHTDHARYSACGRI